MGWPKAKRYRRRCPRCESENWREGYDGTGYVPPLICNDCGCIWDVYQTDEELVKRLKKVSGDD